MNLEARYQYTHFIYPFVIENKNYTSFIYSLLREDKKWTFKTDDYSLDENVYNFFLPYIRKFLFPTLFMSNINKIKLKMMNIKKRAKALSKLSCVTFGYNLSNIKTGNVTGRKYDEIDFDISDIKLLCFENGICFLDIKTQIEDENDNIEFNEILDFNHSFRLLTPRNNTSWKNDAKIKAKNIDNLNDITNFINSVIFKYETKDIEKIYYDKMFTYSYVCVDKKYWSTDQDFKNIKNDFYRLQYVMDGKNNTQLNTDNPFLYKASYHRWKYSIFGFSGESGAVMVSDMDGYNITRMPYVFERTYMYMLYLAMYQRISLINFSQDLLIFDKTMITKLNTKLTEFTHSSWFDQITNSEHGSDIWQKWQKAFRLNELYDEVHREYMEYYELVKASNESQINLIFIILSIFGLVISATRITGVNDALTGSLDLYLIFIAAAVYPIYLILKKIKNKISKKIKNRRFN